MQRKGTEWHIKRTRIKTMDKRQAWKTDEDDIMRLIKQFEDFEKLNLTISWSSQQTSTIYSQWLLTTLLCFLYPFYNNTNTNILQMYKCKDFLQRFLPVPASVLTCFSTPEGPETRDCDKARGFRTCFTRYKYKQIHTNKYSKREQYNYYIMTE